MSIVVCHDCIHANIAHLPRGQAAGYTTGTPDIRWTSADWKAHPGAIRICQDATASDATADWLDVEQFAATNGECAGWYRRAEASYKAGTRPGQRWPAIYTSASNVTPLVNALIAGGVKSGPGLVVANWNLDQSQADAAVAAASGPFPVIGVQFSSGTFYDTDAVSSAWLERVSAAPSHDHKRETDGVTTWAQYAASRNTSLAEFMEKRVLAHPDAAAALGDEIPKAGTPYYTIF